eukprot:305870_1
MARKWLNEFEGAEIMATSTEITALVHNTLLLGYHLYTTIKVSGKNRKMITNGKVFRVTLFTMCLLAFQRVFAVITSFNHQPQFIPCHIWINFLSISYFSCKVSIYFVLLERLFA